MRVCSNCNIEFPSSIRGHKRVPKILCPQCVIGKEIFRCNFCYSKGCTADKFYRAECFECRRDGCSKCVPNEFTCEGMTFDFCDKHKDCDKTRMKEEAKELRKEFPTSLTGKVTE